MLAYASPSYEILMTTTGLVKQLPWIILHTDPSLFHTRYLQYLVIYSNFMITAPTFIFYLSDIMQSYPLHTHNVVLFLVSSWKQTFGVRRVVLVADKA